MTEIYFPIFIFALIGIAVGIFPIIAGRLIAPHRPNDEKLSPFECGFPPFEDARLKFDVRYYLVAILFILFDLEVAFLYPWATIFRDLLEYPNLRILAFIEVMIFVFILTLGFIYAWKKRALEWD